MIDYVIELVIQGLKTDGAHHKQWYLEQVLVFLGVNIDEIDHEPGIAP